MKKISGILVFILAIFLYIMKNGFSYSPYWVNVLNDVLAIPLLLLVMEGIMVRVLPNQFKMNGWYVAGTVIVVSLFFEIIFPSISEKSIADINDIWCYSIGGLYYYIVLIHFFSVKRKQPVTNRLTT